MLIERAIKLHDLTDVLTILTNGWEPLTTTLHREDAVVHDGVPNSAPVHAFPQEVLVRTQWRTHLKIRELIGHPLGTRCSRAPHAGKHEHMVARMVAHDVERTTFVQPLIHRCNFTLGRD